MGGGGGGTGCGWAAFQQVLALWRAVTAAGSIKRADVSVSSNRHQRKPDQTPGCPGALWVLRKEKQTWQTPAEIPVAPALSHACAGKDLGFGFSPGDLFTCVTSETSLKGRRYRIVVGYVTEAGRRENTFSCPALVPDSRKGSWVSCRRDSKAAASPPEVAVFEPFRVVSAAADICPAAPQSAAFPANSVSPVAPAL